MLTNGSGTSLLFVCLFVLPGKLLQGLPGIKVPDLYAFGLL